MWKTLLSLKLLVDADAWQIWGQNETYISYFRPPPRFKNRSRATADKLNLTQCCNGSPVATGSMCTSRSILTLLSAGCKSQRYFQPEFTVAYVLQHHKLCKNNGL